MGMHYRLSNQQSMASKCNNNGMVDGQLQRCSRLRKSSSTDLFCKMGKKGSFHAAAIRKSSALRKSESDNRISFYKELHGLVRTEEIIAVPPISDKESCRSRSLSYESIYFKPQEKCASNDPVKSQSCRELKPKITNRVSKKCANNSELKRMSRSVSFFQKNSKNSLSDDYDYIEVDDLKQSYTRREYIILK